MLIESRKRTSGVRRWSAVAVCTVIGVGTCASALALRVEVGPAIGQTVGAPVAANKPLQVSAGVMSGNVLEKVTPKYPQDAKDAKVQGSVVLHAIVDKTGAVQDLTVVSGPEALRQASLDAVKRWTYKPYLMNGEPIAVETTMTVTFTLAQ